MPRATCPRCQRPLNYCYCEHLSPENAAVDLVILQHPTETRHPMNTARIASLGIKNCALWVGEDFTHHQPLLALIRQKQCYLLFPGADAHDSESFLQHHTPDVIIILDGTWRKARRIYHCNPMLQALPALTLNHDTLSSYRIRKAPHAAALSTIEATVVLLRQIEQNSTIHQPLLDAFDQMVQMQINTMGEAVYRKNYAGKTPQKNE